MFNVLRFPQVLHNQPHGLRRVELGEAALVTFFLLFSFCIGHSRTSPGLLFFLSASVRASPLLLFLAPDTHGLTFLSVSVRASPLHFSASDVHGLHPDFFFLSASVRASPLLICRIDTFDGLFSEKCCAYIRAQVREGFSEYCVNCVKCVNGTCLIRLRVVGLDPLARLDLIGTVGHDDIAALAVRPHPPETQVGHGTAHLAHVHRDRHLKYVVALPVPRRQVLQALLPLLSPSLNREGRGGSPILVGNNSFSIVHVV